MAQRAFENRLSLTGQSLQAGLGFGQALNIPGLLSVIQQPRLAQPTVKGKTFQSGGAIALGAVGGLFSGAGGALSSGGGGFGQ